MIMRRTRTMIPDNRAWPAVLNRQKRARRITKIVMPAIEYTVFPGQNQEQRSTSGGQNHDKARNAHLLSLNSADAPVTGQEPPLLVSVARFPGQLQEYWRE